MIGRKGDMRFNAKFADLVDMGTLSDLSDDDLPEGLRRTVDEGWTCDERGAWLLRDRVATYHGSPEAFTDVTGYEAAVNGRALWDLDLDDIGGKPRAAALARRGIVFARAALHRLNADHPDHPPAVAYLSIGDEDPTDDIPYEADVTFVTAHPGEPPYVRDLQAVPANAVLAIDSTECLE
jgi:hypothetical protein